VQLTISSSHSFPQLTNSPTYHLPPPFIPFYDRYSEISDTDSKPGQESCRNCPSGKYQEDDGAHAYNHDSPATCLGCDKGKFAQGEGSSACAVCPPGQYQDLAAQESCQLCAEGKYNGYADIEASRHDDEEGCYNCAIGKYQTDKGSSDCTLCDAGKFHSIEGSSTAADCTSCASGTYRMAGTDSGCLNCPSGRYNSIPGATCRFEEDSTAGCVNGCKQCEKVSVPKPSRCPYLSPSSLPP
jgi:hypothetical protein